MDKRAIMNLLGPRGLAVAKMTRQLLKAGREIMDGNRGMLVLHDGARDPRTFRLPDRHVFFGYYDLQQLDADGKHLLVHCAPKHADTRRDSAEIVSIDLADNSFHQVATTNAWCWQQGARLRWHPTEKGAVLFNNVAGSEYRTQVFDVVGGKALYDFPRAFYDVSRDMRTGLSLNFSRLQRLRPGYGYPALPDRTTDARAPREDGLFLTQLQMGETKLLYGLNELAARVAAPGHAQHYINHFSFSPSGKRFLFFHLWTPGGRSLWDMRLYAADVEGGRLTCVEEEYVVSHYAWKGDDAIMFTTAGDFKGLPARYVLVNLADGTRRTLESEHLRQDGHPSFWAEGSAFVSDTYPSKHCVQRLFEISLDGTGYQPLADVFSDPLQYGEKRCDLHPRVTPDGRFVTIDNTHAGLRSVLLFRREG